MTPIQTITSAYTSMLVALVLASPAYSADIDSAYTDLDLDNCLILQADDFGASFACPGYKGMPLYIAEGDLRFFVSYGFGAPDEMAASQTLPQFNYVNKTLEWRLSNESGAWKPFATILRWFTQVGDGSEPDGQVLVVTKIEKGNTCHVAYIDAKLTANANEIARQFADNQAPDFDCANNEIFVVPD